jgi:type II secretory pathway component PulK
MAKRTALLLKNDGIAIILVLSVLAVVATIAAAFLITARLETMKTVNFVEGIRAEYIAEAGFAHAKSLLKEDKSSTVIDVDTETWRSAFTGAEVDNDGDGTTESKWIKLLNSSGEMYGRYAVTVTDEASRVNINSAGFHNEDELLVTEGYSTFEVSLSKLFSTLGLSQSTIMRDDILRYRYGGNFPGANDPNGDDNHNTMFLSHDGIDNDADGIVDEPGEGINEPLEFVKTLPFGDDRPFFSVFELKNIPSVVGEFDQIRSHVSAYSVDKNTDVSGVLRLDINQATALEFANVFASVGLTEGGGQLAVNMVDYRDMDYESTALAYNGKIYYGVEGIRINELFIDARTSYAASTLTNVTGPGGDWVVEGTHYKNPNPTLDEFGKGVWHFEGIKPGNYYLRLFGRGAGDFIGDVKIDGTTHASLEHGEMFVDVVTVGIDGRLDLSIYNKEIDKGAGFTTYFAKFHLIQSPDVEYIELMNITNKDVDISGWTIEGLRKKDLLATVPAGTIIQSFDYLVLAVDKDDLNTAVSANVRNNGIGLLDMWNGSLLSAAKVVQLEFSDAISREDDVVCNEPSLYDLAVFLKTSDGRTVDRVEYPDNVTAYMSIERGYPASVHDVDSDGLFDGWSYSNGFPLFSPVGTPTQTNNNLSISGHTIGGMNTEVIVKNGLFANVGEIVAVSALKDWTTISTGELMVFCDKLTTTSYRFEAEGHLVSGSGWHEESRSAPYTDWYASASSGDEGVWVFDSQDRFLDGTYVLTVVGQYGESLSFSVKKNDGTWTPVTPPLTPCPDNCLRFGVVTFGGSQPDALPSKRLEIKITNESSSGDCHFDAIVLSPLNRIDGRINVNTAAEAVLMALPGVTSGIAQDIINGRPYGVSYGIGELLMGNILGGTESKKKEVFRKICNLITVKSDVYEILVTAQTFRKEKRTAEKKLRVIVER